jgi:hypothetical protein
VECFNANPAAENKKNTPGDMLQAHESSFASVLVPFKKTKKVLPLLRGKRRPSGSDSGTGPNGNKEPLSFLIKAPTNAVGTPINLSSRPFFSSSQDRIAERGRRLVSALTRTPPRRPSLTVTDCADEPIAASSISPPLLLALINPKIYLCPRSR